MPLQATIDSLISKFRYLTNEEIEKFHDKISKSPNHVECLRQFFLLMHLTRCRTLPVDVATVLSFVIYDIKTTPQCHDLCLLILKESSPLVDIDFREIFINDKHLAVDLLPLLLLQGRPVTCEAQILNKIFEGIDKKKLPGSDSMKITSFLAHLCIFTSFPLTEKQISNVSLFMGNILRNTSIYLSPNPNSKNFFGRDNLSLVTELDGMQCQEFFTILNLAKYHSPDQLANVTAFSTIRQFLVCISNPSPAITDLLSIILDYCVRVLVQCERRPLHKDDLTLQNMCLLECVYLLGEICRLYPSKSASIFDIMKRIYDLYVTTCPSTREKKIVAIQVITFALQHDEVVTYDSTTMLETLLKLISNHFHDDITCFEMIQFLKENLLEKHKQLIIRYFPNILKILAWRPRTFYQDFLFLLPSLFTANESVEMFHSLVDLPCLTASLINMNSALPNSAFRSMLNFITRNTSGIGDTFAKLNEYHKMIEASANHPRVTNCGDVVPILLTRYFEIILKFDTTHHLQRLIPAILERSRLLLQLQNDFAINIQLTLSTYICRLFARHPLLVIENMSELIDYLTITRNFDQCPSLYIQLTWAVGEYTSTTYATNCTLSQIGSFYETLECSLHELIHVIHDKWDTNLSKLITTLTTTLAKLSTRSQDLLSRTSLTLTKTSGQIKRSEIEQTEKEILYSRITQLISVLQMPLAASSIFNPPTRVLNGQYHRQVVSVPVVLNSLTQLESQ